jgi:hypothetical protein
MPAPKRRGGQRRGDRPAQEVLTDRSESARGASYTSYHDAPLVGLPPDEQYECPVCGGTLYVNWKVGRWSQRPEPFYHCFSCANDYSNAEYNAELRARNIWPYRIKQGDFSQLGSPLGRSHRHAEPQPPPTEASVDGWRSGLLASPDGLRYLIGKRGLTLETIKRYELGYDQDRHAITFPVREEDGELVNVRRRFLDPEADPKVIGLARPAVLYPDVPPDGGLLLVAGEIDALMGRQNGLPTVTTTCGTALPDHLAQRLAGRKVFAMYDVGEEAAAARTVAKLRGLGSPATVVELGALGLPAKADLSDFYCQGGKTWRLRALIRRQARRAA